MGHIVAPYGVRGWMKVQPLTEAVDGLLAYPSWWLSRDGDDWSNRRLLEGRVHGSGLVARIEGVADRTEALHLRGVQIAVQRADLPAAGIGEYYWADLIGLSVVNQQGETLGRIAEIFSTGANDVLVVRAERERLIPFVEPVVLEVDLQAERLLVDWQSDY